MENTCGARFVLGLIVLCAFAMVLDAGGQQTVGPVKKHGLQVETTVSLGVAAQLSATRAATTLGGVYSQGYDPTPAVLGTVRQSFLPWLGYTANFGYTRTTQENRGPFNSYGQIDNFSIQENVYETSLAYMVQKHVSPRLTGFADLGGGVLAFLPVHRGDTAKNFVPSQNPSLVPSVQLRPLGVAGVGVDVRLGRHLGLRAEYRGLLYKYPDFQGRVGRALTETSEPTVSVVYRFGK